MVAARSRAAGSMSARRGASEREKERERGRGGDVFSKLGDARCPKDQLHVRAPHDRQSGEKGEGRDVVAQRLLGAEGHEAQEDDSASGWEEEGDDLDPDTPIGCPRAEKSMLLRSCARAPAAHLTVGRCDKHMGQVRG